MRKLISAAAICFLSATAAGQGLLSGLGDESGGAGGARSRVVIRVVPSHLVVAPGQTFHVALDMQVAEEWWYYSHAPGNNGEVEVLPATPRRQRGSAEARVDPLAARSQA